MDSSFSHRSTLKQSNKKFKSRHASKSSIKSSNKGKIDQKSRINTAKGIATHKADRKNRAKIEQQKKRYQVLANARLFSGSHGVPRIVSVVPLCPDVNAFQVTESLFSSVNEKMELIGGSARLNIQKLRSKLQFIPTSRHLLRILDAVKVSDMVIFVLSSNEEVDAFGESIMRAIKVQGVPFVLSVVQHLNDHPPKKQTDIRKSLLYYMNHHFPNEHRLFSASSEKECDACLRHVSSCVPKPISWRNRHSYFLTDSMEFSATETTTTSSSSSSTEQESVQRGLLKLSGYLRGRPLNPNRLVHILNHGDFQIERVEAAVSPFSSHQGTMMTGTKSHQNTTMAVDPTTEPRILARPDPAFQESLVIENEPDPMDAEQTWPTEEELAEAEERVRQHHHQAMLGEDGEEAGNDAMELSMVDDLKSLDGVKKKRVPKGTSSYQAAWIMEDEEEEEQDEGVYSEEEDDDHTMGRFQMEEEPLSDDESVSPAQEEEEDEEYEEVDLEDRNELMNELDEEEDEKQRQEYLSRKNASTQDLEFPDEVDTPLDTPARERFQRYRGLKSFRSSPWDPYENLPVDYARIFQFRNFKRNRQRIFKMLEEEEEQLQEQGTEQQGNVNGGVVPVGTYVSIVLKNVPATVMNRSAEEILPVFTLLPNEQKMTVQNFVIQRQDPSSTQDQDTSAPIKSKDPMVFFCGFRRFIVRPIYSTYTRGGANNVHRFERYLHPGRSVVGTVYAPIQYGPAPVLMFKWDESVSGSSGNAWTDANPPHYVGSGSILDSDPLRIIAKRILLTGHPYKVHKRSAVIRYMFFNPQDVHYFKPIQLYTKLGRTGHIKESLGTHGYMKCVFDGPLKQHDTVCMSLYKRVFPKWNTQVFVEAGRCDDSFEEVDMTLN